MESSDILVVTLSNEIVKQENFVDFEIKFDDGSGKSDGFLSEITCAQLTWIV